MKRLFSTVYFILICSLLTNAQERFLKKAASALTKNDVEKALYYVAKYESKEGIRPQTHFTRYLIYVHHKDSLLKLDSAYIELNAAYKNISQVTPSLLKECCEEINFCPELQNEHKSYTDTLLFNAYKKTNSIESMSRFISIYPTNNLIQEAKAWRCTLSFVDAKNKNTEEDYRAFLREYPFSNYSDSAESLLWKAAFSSARSIDNIESYSNFIKNYPKAKQVKNANKRITELSWEETKKKNVKEEYVLFLKNFPNAPQAKEANEIIEELSWKEVASEKSSVNVKKFIEDYPTSIHIEEANNLYSELLVSEKYQKILLTVNDYIDVLKFGPATNLLDSIDAGAPQQFLNIKDSLLTKITTGKKLLKLSLGIFKNITGSTTSFIILGFKEEDGSLYCEFHSFEKGIQTEALSSDGIFSFLSSGDKLDLKWSIDEYNKTMGKLAIMELGNHVNIKLPAGKVYKKVSDDFDAEVSSLLK